MENLKTQQSPVVSPIILNLCLRETPSGELHDYRGVVVIEKLYFENVFRPH